jgi:hypothetical protein
MSWATDNEWWRAQARERWSPTEPEALLLRAWLSTPIAYDGYDPITLEGALQSVVCMRETGRLPDDVFSDCPLSATLEETDIRIPIADVTSGGAPIACASVGWFSPDAVATKRQSWKRARADHYQRAIIKTSEASTKTQMVLKATVTALHVDFYVLGDRSKLTDLLRDVSHLGASRAGGVGGITGWEALPAPGPWWIRGPGDRLMRSMPADASAAWVRYDERPATVRAPYWHHRTRTLCHVPTQTIGEPLAAGAAGRFFITPHAVERYRERVPGKARLSYEQALRELVGLSSDAKFAYVREDGAELWRLGLPTRLRFRVERAAPGLPQITSVMMPFDHRPGASA